MQVGDKANTEKNPWVVSEDEVVQLKANWNPVAFIRLDGFNDMFVYDIEGNQIGLSILIDGEHYYMPVARAPLGATSQAWPE